MTGQLAPALATFAPALSAPGLSEPYEVRYWTDAPGVSEDELKRAVMAVGNSVDAVRAHLARGAH